MNDLTYNGLPTNKLPDFWNKPFVLKRENPADQCDYCTHEVWSGDFYVCSCRTKFEALVVLNALKLLTGSKATDD